MWSKNATHRSGVEWGCRHGTIHARRGGWRPQNGLRADRVGGQGTQIIEEVVQATCTFTPIEELSLDPGHGFDMRPLVTTLNGKDQLSLKRPDVRRERCFQDATIAPLMDLLQRLKRSQSSVSIRTARSGAVKAD